MTPVEAFKANDVPALGSHGNFAYTTKLNLYALGYTLVLFRNSFRECKGCPVGQKRHLDVERPKLPRNNVCLSIVRVGFWQNGFFADFYF